MTLLRQRMLEDMAYPQPCREHTVGLHPAGRRLRKILSPLTGRTRSGGDSRLSGLFDADPNALGQQCQRRDRRAAFPVQGDAEARLGRRTRFRCPRGHSGYR